MVYSSCEFQRQDSFRGVPELLLGHPYNLSYLAGPCLDCLSLSFSCCLNGIYVLIPGIAQEATRAASVYLS